MPPDETQLARVALSSISGFEQLPETSTRGAAWHGFSVHAANALEMGWDIRDLVELLFRIEEDRNSLE